MLGVTHRAKEAATKLWPSIAARFQQGWRWLVKQRDPVTWTVLRARLTTLPLLPNSNAGRLAVLVGLVVLLLLVLPWYAKGHKDKNGVVAYPNATLVNPILAGIGAALLIYAAIRQAQTAINRHVAQTDADRQRRIIESFSTAVEQLASEHIEVRLGGIYALERISQESPRDYWTVMETLTAFVRERTQRAEAERTAKPLEERRRELAHSLWETAGQPDGHSDEFWGQAVVWEPFGEPPTTDVAAVLTVIRRRSEDRHELEGTLDFSRAVLRQADLGGAHLKGAELIEAHLEDADLPRVHLEDAFLNGAHLENADLTRAHLERARLIGAHLKDAGLFRAHLEGAVLFRAHFEGAFLERAHLEGTLLNGANLIGAVGLTQAQIDHAVGDDKTQLPQGLSRPARWTARSADGTRCPPHNSEL
jgi:hypothetical protein